MAVEARVAYASSFDAIERVYAKQQSYRATVAATTARERMDKLRRLHQAVLARSGEIRQALWDDYGKPAPEVDLSEIYPVVGEARHAIRHLRRWMKPHRVPAPLALLGSRSEIVYQPKGVVLIISPWNFPITLTLGPLISAIAAGNCVMVKPSEMTPHSSACMKRILAELFDEQEVAVIEGDAAVAEALLRRKFDHIFFTGSTAVGKIVMRAAAEHLTPVTLELGGKSPAIVDGTADLRSAAKRIAWGKFTNQGQICIAPDYVLVDRSVHAQFVDLLREVIEVESGLLVNDRHAGRVRRLLDDAVQRGAKVSISGRGEGREMSPTVLEDVPTDATVLQEEIFGPILPVVPYDNLGSALDDLDQREHPLVLYLFSRSREVINNVLLRTRAGGTVINNTLIHFFQINLPFGGVGASGMGKAHGFFGFQSFSNARAVLEQRSRVSPIEFLYPPYTRWKKKLIEFTVRYL
jgi:aldehyde dehydrogenase (NAD+)